jgi:hypothetical protein
MPALPVAEIGSVIGFEVPKEERVEMSEQRLAHRCEHGWMGIGRARAQEESFRRGLEDRHRGRLAAL